MLADPRRSSSPAPLDLSAAREVLGRVWGHADFRGLQSQVVAEVLAGRDVMAVLPTGGGKSVCYQIPAILRFGVGLVVSPLIALMTDQVEALKQQGVAAARLDSGVSMEERSAIWRAARSGELDLLYVSPEGLAAGSMLERLSDIDLSLIAIDEAHCVSQWGHDFRPDYRSLGRLAEIFPGVPRIAVTATADARTREDILASLRLGEARVFVDSFARPNLQLSAERKINGSRARTDAAVVELVRERRGKSGVVYCGSRDGCERVAQTLRDAGTNAIAYHAGFDAKDRDRRLERFLAEDGAVMVATIAFGMGVDKPDVRFVIHADPPGSLEAYWQEIGRAGRDGEPAEGITLYGPSDIAWSLRRLEGRPMAEEVKQVQTRKVRQLFAMLDGAVCRPQAVRRYFGETDAQPCGVCDICGDPPATFDAVVPAQKALAAVQRLGERFGRTRVVDHLLGKTKDVQNWEANLSTWGIGADLSLTAWRDVIDHLLFEGLLVEDPNEGKPIIQLGDSESVRAVYRGERPIQVRKAPVRVVEAERPRRNAGRNLAAEALDTDVRARFEVLRAWRRDRAAEQHVPPYVIFQDKTLVEIALSEPRNLDALGRISGVGAGKLERYGKGVLEALASAD
ncbi:ATP-dependent DNA helicase RecQ [Brevundimonas bullata]|uniref:DNA helicase RecQ n=1 Tax=Brevundimonas bullata TaxID=13160 RepID=A0A7W7N4A4_9CAUL|nr:DNA helicase RecQ [Brevundimonas bullata]MBB4798047.1 ATP-dependent DNA helicase RecQ [Brevundimonas bullata]MBB6383639.1 ATP-dependent DNA helicase RecQ [Brevundimonas bullata]